MDLAEFGDLVGRETSNKLDNVKKEINAMEERILTRMETKINSIVEEAVCKGSFSFVPFDRFGWLLSKKSNVLDYRRHLTI